MRLILLGKDWSMTKGFGVSLTEQPLTTWDVHTHSSHRPLSSVVICRLVCDVFHHSMQPETCTLHLFPHKNKCPCKLWHFSVFAITHHMVVKLLQALPPLPRTQQEVFSPLMLSIKSVWLQIVTLNKMQIQNGEVKLPWQQFKNSHLNW